IPLGWRLGVLVRHALRRRIAASRLSTAGALVPTLPLDVLCYVLCSVTRRSGAYSPQSSSSCGARASAGGVRETTSRSAPHSGQGRISPATVPSSETAAAHSGHSAIVAPPA